MDPVIYNKETKSLKLIDQTLLPVHYKTVICTNVDQVAHAIKTLQVRGAPAIGIAAAYGLVLSLNNSTDSDFITNLDSACKLLIKTRPTAVNLANALTRVMNVTKTANITTQVAALKIALAEANKIKQEDIEMCVQMSEFGASLLKDGQTWMTHCNAGALATSGYGTALGIFRTAHKEGKNFKVYVNETRPLLQGSRITAWELQKEGIDLTLTFDSAAASLIQNFKVDAIVVGADRITSKGFVANKTGTYALALMARYHAIPFYVAAPETTFDLSISYADEIIIEQRDPNEVRFIGKHQIAPKDVPVHNPAFDITPPELVTKIITNRGIIGPIYRDSIPSLFGLPGDD